MAAVPSRVAPYPLPGCCCNLPLSASPAEEYCGRVPFEAHEPRSRPSSGVHQIGQISLWPAFEPQPGRGRYASSRPGSGRICLLLPVVDQYARLHEIVILFAHHLALAVLGDHQPARNALGALSLEQAHVVSSDQSICGFDLVVDAMHLFNAEGNVCPRLSLDRLQRPKLNVDVIWSSCTFETIS